MTLENKNNLQILSLYTFLIMFGFVLNFQIKQIMLGIKTYLF